MGRDWLRKPAASETRGERLAEKTCCFGDGVFLNQLFHGEEETGSGEIFEAETVIRSDVVGSVDKNVGKFHGYFLSHSVK